MMYSKSMSLNLKILVLMFDLLSLMFFQEGWLARKYSTMFWKNYLE